MKLLTRYRNALAALDAKIPVTSDRKASNFLSRYLFGSPQGGANQRYKYLTHHKAPSVRFLPPTETWRPEARTEALETLVKLPASLLQALVVGGIPLSVQGRRATITPHEQGDEICPEVRAFWAQAAD